MDNDDGYGHCIVPSTPAASTPTPNLSIARVLTPAVLPRAITGSRTLVQPAARSARELISTKYYYPHLNELQLAKLLSTHYNHYVQTSRNERQSLVANSNKFHFFHNTSYPMDSQLRSSYRACPRTKQGSAMDVEIDSMAFSTLLVCTTEKYAGMTNARLVGVLASFYRWT